MKHLNISIRGKVQRVFFRLTTKAVADQVGVRGFVVNLKDGSVYIEAEGDEFSLDSLLEFCKEGPEGAVVESVEIEEGEMKGFSNFEVVKRVQS
ncbi:MULTISPECIES: acylphosphatase [unclassified Sphingobacterium]|uniref:acylphosphatase n=1 Tax=unclassified Sphingobacterium TaxID=2609468 RepID=UPI0025CFFEBE|nr:MULTISPECIES: acylphosphatase [unclassified Sphingobacterium]